MPEQASAKPLTPEELAALRDELTILLSKLTTETVPFLERCRDALNQLLPVVTPEPPPPALSAPPLSPAPAQPPHWFTELEHQLRHSPGPIPKLMAQRLLNWNSEREASTESLESSLMELHIEYWDQWRSRWMTDDAPRAEAFAKQLLTILDQEFHLTPYYPTNFQDHPPGWIQLAAGNRLTTGRVREVIRPGLVDQNGDLRLPARVNVE